MPGHLAVVTYKHVGNGQEESAANQVLWGQVVAEPGRRIHARLRRVFLACAAVTTAALIVLGLAGCQS